MYCGNNVYSRKLKQNGGTELFGNHAKCFKKGYGIGYNTPIGNVANFLAEYGGKYKPYINQNLYYGDGEVPRGSQLATLGQSLSRGYALGRVAKAKEMMRMSQGKGQTHPPPSSSIVRSHKWANDHGHQ